MSAFEDAADVLFVDENMSLAASWAAGGVGTPVPVRVLKKSPDLTMDFGPTRAVVPTDVIRVRASEVANPRAGDVFTIGDAKFEVIGKPLRDSRRIFWSCDTKAL